MNIRKKKRRNKKKLFIWVSMKIVFQNRPKKRSGKRYLMDLCPRLLSSKSRLRLRMSLLNQKRSNKHHHNLNKLLQLRQKLLLKFQKL